MSNIVSDVVKYVRRPSEKAQEIQEWMDAVNEIHRLLLAFVKGAKLICFKGEYLIILNDEVIETTFAYEDIEFCRLSALDSVNIFMLDNVLFSSTTDGKLWKFMDYQWQPVEIEVIKGKVVVPVNKPAENPPAPSSPAPEPKKIQSLTTPDKDDKKPVIPNGWKKEGFSHNLARDQHNRLMRYDPAADLWEPANN